MTDEKPWLNGKPYYCIHCGYGGAEYVACEMPDCQLETEADAQARQRIHAQMAPINEPPTIDDISLVQRAADVLEGKHG